MSREGDEQIMAGPLVSRMSGVVPTFAPENEEPVVFDGTVTQLLSACINRINQAIEEAERATPPDTGMQTKPGFGVDTGHQRRVAAQVREYQLAITHIEDALVRYAKGRTL